MTVAKPWLAERQFWTARMGRRSLPSGSVRTSDLNLAEHTWPRRHRFDLALLLSIFGLLPDHQSDGGNRCACQLGRVQRTPEELLRAIDDAIGEPRMPSGACTCIQAATQEDGLCDECRVWCVVADLVDGQPVITNATTGRDASIGRAATRGYRPIPEHQDLDDFTADAVRRATDQ